MTGRPALLLAALVVAGCGGADDDPAPTTAQRPPAATVATTYAEATGAQREVDARLRVVAVRTPADELPVALPADTEPVLADVEIEDAGPDPFPLTWAVFSARTRDGRTLREALRLPPRRVRDGTQIVSVGFAVPEGDALRDVRVRSIVDVWPFRATLAPPDG